MANILVVDDALFIRRMLSDNLTKAGHTIVSTASNGEEAILEYKKCKPDLVFLDITMPEMDGLNALKHIVKHDPNANVVMCTAMGQQKMVMEAIQFGAKDFIIKPFDINNVISVADRYSSNT